MGKILLIASIVISVATIGIGYLNHEKLATASQEGAETATQLEKAKSDIAKSKTELADAQEKLTAANKAKDDFNAQATVAKATAEKVALQVPELEKQLKEKDQKITESTADLAAKDTKIAELEAKQTGVVAPTTTTADTSKVAELEAANQELKTLLEKLQGQLTSSTADVKALQEKENNRSKNVMSAGLKGRILAVNQGWNFVVLSLGDRSGVVKNAEMLVSRGNQMIGKLRITSVEPSSSIADIIVNSVPRGMSIQPGDNVIYAGTNN